MANITEKADKLMLRIAIPTIASAGILIVVALILGTQNTSSENNAYLRVVNCIVSHNAKERQQVDIEECYVTVENELNIKLQRYDSSDPE